MHARILNVVMIALLAMALAELAYSFASKKLVHSFRDTVSSITLGVGQQALNVFLSAQFLLLYAVVQSKVGLLPVDPGVWWHWVILVFACDLCYYLGHRSAHNVNLFVGGHVVHHQAEDFNLLSSLRQSWTAWVLMTPFFLPLAIAGVPVAMFVQGQVGIMIFQFISHSGTFRRKLGVLDRIFITPTNHRIHHGDRHPYWGANCGGMFVIWDRLFGTYVEEDPAIEVKCGSGLFFNFYDPFESNVEYFRRIWFVARHRRGAGKLTIWFQSPQVLDAELDRFGYDRARLNRQVNRRPLARAEKLATTAALVVLLLLFGAHRAAYGKLPVGVSVLLGVVVFGGIWLIGALLSGSFDRFFNALPSAVAPPRPAISTTPDAATSAPGTPPGNRTSATPPAHTDDVAERTPDSPSRPRRGAVPHDPARGGPRTPSIARSESHSAKSRRSTKSPRDVLEP